MTRAALHPTCRPKKALSVGEPAATPTCNAAAAHRGLRGAVAAISADTDLRWPVPPPSLTLTTQASFQTSAPLVSRGAMPAAVGCRPAC